MRSVRLAHADVLQLIGGRTAAADRWPGDRCRLRAGEAGQAAAGRRRRNGEGRPTRWLDCARSGSPEHSCVRPAYPRADAVLGSVRSRRYARP
jgi:hypothetical protein